MAEPTITVTGTWITPIDGQAGGNVVFVAADIRDILNAKIASQAPVIATLSGGTISQTLIQTPGGYRVTENINGAPAVSYVIGGTSSIDLSSVNAGTAQFDASGIGVLPIENLAAGGTVTGILADMNKLKRSVAATDQTYNIDGSLNWPIGGQIAFGNGSTGRIHIAGINGASVVEPDSFFILRKQRSTATVTKMTATEWWVAGDVVLS